MRFRRLGRCFIDWASAVVGEGDTCQLSVSFTHHSCGPIYETLAQSAGFNGTLTLQRLRNEKRCVLHKPFFVSWCVIIEVARETLNNTLLWVRLFTQRMSLCYFGCYFFLQKLSVMFVLLFRESLIKELLRALSNIFYMCLPSQLSFKVSFH